MSEEAKPKKKINLKSRLSAVRGVGSLAATPPADESSDGVPAPPITQPGEVPAPQISTGGLAPPAHLMPPKAPEPEEAKPTAQAQTIKVEVGAEVIAERKKATRKALIVALIAAVVFGTAGFFIGGVKEKGDQSRKAIEQAKVFAQEVEEANAVMSTLSDELRIGAEGLSKDKYPDKLAEALKKINVPFTTDSLKGRPLGLPGDVLGMIIDYAGGATQVNQKKDSLRRRLGNDKVKQSVEKHIAQTATPVVNFSVLMGKPGKTMTAELVENKEPYKIADDWPKKYTVLQIVKGKPKDVEVQRWQKDDFPFEEGNTALPLVERSIAKYNPHIQVRYGLVKALREAKELVDGKSSPIPSQQTDGLIKQGEKLVEALKKVMQAG